MTEPCLPQQLVSLEQFSILRITGDDRLSYLQGQVTCDVSKLSDGEATIGAHCNPKGKMWSNFRLAKLPDEFLWLQHASVTPQQLPELKKYAVFSKVAIEDASAQWYCYGLIGEQAPRWLESAYGTEVAEHGGLIEGGLVLRLSLPSPRYLFLLRTPAPDPLAQLPRAEPATWQALDITAGYPWLEAAGCSEYIPQMLNLQALGGISFTKGCYTGQETVARMKYLGRNKRALFILHGQTASAAAAGDTLEVQLGENWRRAGSVINAVSTGEALHVLAVLPNDSDPGQSFRLADSPDIILTLQPLPYSLDEQ